MSDLSVSSLGNGPTDYGNYAGFWFDHADGVTKRAYIVDKSHERPGFCYVNIISYCCEIARRPLSEFKIMVDNFAEGLGPDPLGSDVVADLSAMMMRLRPDLISDRSAERAVGDVHDYLKDSKIRLTVDEINEKLHLGDVRNSYCSCNGPVCTHGWNFQMISTVLMMGRSRRVGASDFNLSEFMRGGLKGEDEEDFELAYTSLSVDPTTKKSSKAKVDAWNQATTTTVAGGLDKDELLEASRLYVERADRKNGTNLMETLPKGFSMKRGPPPPAPPLPASGPRVPKVYLNPKPVGPLPALTPNLRGKLQKPEVPPEVESAPLNEILGVLRGLSEANQVLSERMDRESELREESELTIRRFLKESGPPSPKEKTRHRAQPVSTVVPEDSSSELERYGKTFMKQGTEVSVGDAMTSADRHSGRKQLAINTYLVEGYSRNPEIQKAERVSLKKLKPINGLPQPFTSNRLNFLANMHTGLGRAKTRFPGPVVASVFATLRSEALTPVDSLVQKVLSTSMDKKLQCYTSNAFRLPYIELGMHVSEDSLVAMFDLLQLEYKQTWFQEMKFIVVPDFHADYKGSKHSPVDQVKDLRSKKVVPESSASGRERSGKKQPQLRRSRKSGWDVFTDLVVS